ncbi:hypothetical protein PHMEG_00016014 [Phytophthora megakarya]|uniref:RNase H type-1 domain-containing protein n=1 Tax=Phytophthora megakarya TaxID=4795 RepID=A0A225VZT9_9STRA|nr:hypothetical protein PHMEG_00016014 [Phytophthora megakarya]
MDPKDQTNDTDSGGIRRSKPVWVHLTNVSDGTARCYKYSSVVLWIPKESSHMKWGMSGLIRKEQELYECWLAEQPPAANRKEYTPPARILARPTEDSVAPRKFMLGHPESDDRGDGVNNNNCVKFYDDSEASVATGLDEETSGEPDTRPTEFSDARDDGKDPAEDSVDMLELTYISVMLEIEAEIASGDRNDDDDWYEHIPNEMELADYSHELAFLPDLTEPSSTVPDYTGPNVMNKSLSEDEQQKLIEVLKRHEGIRIASGNALPRHMEWKWFQKGYEQTLTRLIGRFIQDFVVYAAALYQLKEEDFEPGTRSVFADTRFSTLEWVHTSKSLFGRTTQFAVKLSPWHLVVNRVNEKDYAFAQLLQAGLTSFVDLEDSLATVTPPTKGSSTVRMDPQLLYARLPRSYYGFVLLFDGSAKTEKYGGCGSRSWIVWRLPDWTIVTAASAHLEATTVNLAEYSGMNNVVQAALDIGATDLVIAGDSRLAIRQSLE